ncbi:hypothetical protein KPL74_15075 [Bacillus sp. NP157]|nr:hypothetical protein KPL74_15075 [Bacillus sp. NP157]
MATPSFFDQLGLPAHADEVMVRRAYASLLRGIDPETDPAAFERLRTAYEEARAWLFEHPADAAPDVPREPAVAAATSSSPAEFAVGAVETVVTPPENILPADTGGDPADVVPRPEDIADDLARRFQADVAAQPASAVHGLLDTALASLRMRYVDAPGQLEDRIVEQLMACSIRHRPEVFDAAAILFHWHEIGHLRRSDPRQLWIDRVLGQRETWRSFEPRWQAKWLELLRRSEAGVDDWLARRWPDVERLQRNLPDWITLHATPRRLAAWRDAYAALPGPVREESRARAMPAASMLMRTSKPVPWYRTRWRFRIASWAFAAIGIAVLAQRYGPDLSSVPSLTDTMTPVECAALYDRLDQPGAFDHVALTEMGYLKDRAHRCVAQGLWHPSSHLRQR